ncbi:unnamed protein product [Pylaiella littoralis]
MITIPTSVLVACVVSSLWRQSCAWVAGTGIRPARQIIHSSSDRSCFRARFPSSGTSYLQPGRVRQTASSEQEEQEGSAVAGKCDETEPGAPVKQQPWWEEERKTKGLPTLSRATQWRMFLSLKDPAKGGEAGESTEVAVRVRFDEEQGFEPPQGSLEIIEDNPYFTQQAGEARWTLSEAEDTRGAGLWVWGLFKDPLYPFLLLQVNNLEITLKGGAKISAGRLYVKVDHRRDDELGPILKSGTVGVKLIERVRVDPLGMAEADITSVVPCGSVQFRPV